jgi:hypothetical protein
VTRRIWMVSDPSILRMGPTPSRWGSPAAAQPHGERRPADPSKISTPRHVLATDIAETEHGRVEAKSTPRFRSATKENRHVRIAGRAPDWTDPSARATP